MVPFVVSKTASSFVPLPGRPFVYSARSAAVGGRTSPGGGGGAGGIAAAAEPAASGVMAASCFVQGFFAGSIWSAVSGLGSGCFFSQLESASTTISVLHRIAKTLALRSTGDRDQRAADDGVPAVRGPPVRGADRGRDPAPSGLPVRRSIPQRARRDPHVVRRAERRGGRGLRD